MPEADADLRRLARLARSGRRVTTFTPEAPTHWNPTEVDNPATGGPFTDASAWDLVADRLERGEGITKVTLHKPPGAVAYEFCIPMTNSTTDLYVKIQLSHDGQRIVGRSFHYSDRRSSRG